MDYLNQAKLLLDALPGNDDNAEDFLCNATAAIAFALVAIAERLENIATDMSHEDYESLSRRIDEIEHKSQRSLVAEGNIQAKIDNLEEKTDLDALAHAKTVGTLASLSVKVDKFEAQDGGQGVFNASIAKRLDELEHQGLAAEGGYLLNQQADRIDALEQEQYERKERDFIFENRLNELDNILKIVKKGWLSVEELEQAIIKETY